MKAEMFFDIVRANPFRQMNKLWIFGFSHKAKLFKFMSLRWYVIMFQIFKKAAWASADFFQARAKISRGPREEGPRKDTSIFKKGKKYILFFPSKGKGGRVPSYLSLLTHMKSCSNFHIMSYNNTKNWRKWHLKSIFKLGNNEQLRIQLYFVFHKT